VVHTENKREVSPSPPQSCHANNAITPFPPLPIRSHPLSSRYTSGYHATPGCYHLFGYTWLMLHLCFFYAFCYMPHPGSPATPPYLATHGSCYTCVFYAFCYMTHPGFPATPPLFHFMSSHPQTNLCSPCDAHKYTMPTTIFPSRPFFLCTYTIYTHM
jgi:hypothetical protein